jgi:hypothetical protein
MKYLLFLLIQCALVFRAGYADGERYINLTHSDGEVVRAKVVSYDKTSDRVVIERDDHKRYTFKASHFCDADEAMIRNWESIGELMSDACLKITVQRVEDRIDLPEVGAKRIVLRGIDPADQEVQDYMPMDHYVIILDNQTHHAFDPITVEAIRFMTIEELHPDRGIDRKTKNGVRKESFDLGFIREYEQRKIKTRELRHESIVYEVKSRIYAKDVAELEGVWIRVYTTLPDGTKFLVREIKKSEELWNGINWSDATKKCVMRNR